MWKDEVKERADVERVVVYRDENDRSGSSFAERTLQKKSRHFKFLKNQSIYLKSKSICIEYNEL